MGGYGVDDRDDPSINHVIAKTPPTISRRPRAGYKSCSNPADKMELLYSSRLPQSRVHAVAWSGMNMVALSVSVRSEGVITEACRR